MASVKDEELDTFDPHDLRDKSSRSPRTRLSMDQSTSRDVGMDDDGFAAEVRDDTDFFAPFRPLMVSMSGVKSMVVLEKNGKKVFLIGEIHQPNFCSEKGFVPICSIVEDYLKNTTHKIDFMFEIFNKPNFLYFGSSMPLQQEIKDAVSRKENVGFERVCTDTTCRQISPSEPLSVLELLRLVLYPYIPVSKKLGLKIHHSFENARVSWLDPTVFWHNIMSSSDLLVFKMFEFLRVERSLTNYFPEKNKASKLYKIRLEINKILKIDTSPEIPWAYNNQDLDESLKEGELYPDEILYKKATRQSKVLFFRKYFNALMQKQSKFYAKCLQPNRYVPVETYGVVFMQHDYPTISSFYSHLARFFVDMFTVCRLLKEDPTWYKNIVVYVRCWLDLHEPTRMLC